MHRDWKPWNMKRILYDRVQLFMLKENSKYCLMSLFSFIFHSKSNVVELLPHLLINLDGKVTIKF